MASLSPNLSKLNPAQLIALADLVLGKLNPPSPATPPFPGLAAKVTALGTKNTAARTANDAYEAGKAALVTLKQARDAAADDLRDQHKVVVSGVESDAGGDPMELSKSGYALAGVAGPAAPTGQVLNLSVTASEMEGAVDVGFDPEPTAKTYDVQIATVDPVAGPWTTKAQPTTSTVTLDGLTSGTRVWVRVRAIGAKGPGPWSDPATKIVP